MSDVEIESVQQIHDDQDGHEGKAASTFQKWTQNNNQSLSDLDITSKTRKLKLMEKSKVLLFLRESSSHKGHQLIVFRRWNHWTNLQR